MADPKELTSNFWRHGVDRDQASIRLISHDGRVDRLASGLNFPTIETTFERQVDLSVVTVHRNWVKLQA